MKTVNEVLLEKQIAHSVYLERYKNGQARDVVAGLAKMYKKLIGDISLLSESQLLRMGEQLIASTIASGSAPVFADYLEELKAFAEKEGGYQVKLIADILPVKVDLKSIAPTQLWATIESKPFQGALMKDHLSKFTSTQVEKVWGAVQQGIVEGRPLNDILRVVRGTRENAFTDGIIARNGREAETLVRTSIGHAAAETRKLVGKENSDIIAKELWVSTLDGRTTPICQAMDGATREPGASVWSNGEYGEPGMIHWNCFPGFERFASFSDPELITSRNYTGKVIIIRTSSDLVITCTPNHPILTDRGFVQAQFLNIGGHVVKKGGGKGVVFIDPINKKMESTFQDFFSSSLESGRMIPVRVPISSKDFHGDGTDNEIGIVAVNSLLWKNDKSFRFKVINSDIFKLGSFSSLIKLAGLCHFNGFMHALYSALSGLVCRAYKRFNLFSGRVIHSCLLLLRSISWLNSMPGKNTINNAGASSKSMSDSIRSNTFVKKIDNKIVIESENLSSGIDAKLSEFDTNKGGTITESLSHLGDASKLGIEFDKIISITYDNFSGQVYNLQTSEHLYICNSIIVHNCRSTLSYVTKSWKDLGIDVDEMDPGTRASMDGQVPADVTYQTWLKGQDKDTVIDILGPARAELFLSGKETLNSFVNDGKLLTLDQLNGV